MRRLILPFVVGLASLCAPSEAGAGQAGVDRLPPDVLDVVPPSAHVRGEPGRMAVRPSSCRTLPTDQTRRRIVDVAAQEWAFFGFSVVDRTVDASDAARDGSRVGGRGGVRSSLRAWRPRSPGTGPLHLKGPGSSTGRTTRGTASVGSPLDGTPPGPRRSCRG